LLLRLAVRCHHFCQGPTPDSHAGSWQKTDFYGGQLLIQKSPTLVTGAITNAAIVTAAVVAAAIITGAITAAITAAIVTAAAAARPRRRRHPDPTATAAAAAAPTDVVPTAATPITAATPARAIAVPICFGVGRNGGSSEC
jgi:hypothetical protein